MTPERIEELEKAERKLRALEAGGVDIWDGYYFAMEAIHAEEEYEELLQEIIGELLDNIVGNVYEPSERGAGFALNGQGRKLMIEYLRNFKIERRAE